MNAVVEAIPHHQKRSALAALASRMGVEADNLFLSSLKAVAFKSPNATTEQLLALCVVANQYQLNPFLKELYAFPDKGGGLVPIVSVDGWSRIINDHPAYDGMEFIEAEDGSWVECVIYRKDRSHPLKAREWLAECKRGTDPWRSHPRRMLRHKSMIQAARMAFGFAGIYEPDEGERIIEGQTAPVALQGATQTERLKAMLTPEPVAEADLVPVVDQGAAVEADQQAGVDAWLADNAEPEDGSPAVTGKPGRGRKA